MGRISGAMFIIDDAERTQAKQHAMLEIDEAYAARWVKTMRELVAEGLEDEEFTMRRMGSLKLWEKGRKREQRHLHYSYDPRRRNPKLVQADMDKEREKIHARAAELEARIAGREFEDLGTEPRAPKGSVSHTIPQIRVPVRTPMVAKRKPVRSLEHLPAGTIKMISQDVETEALEYMTDDEVRRGYMQNLNLTEEQAQQYVDILNGKQSDD
jgi:hypothetical protein